MNSCTYSHESADSKSKNGEDHQDASTSSSVAIEVPKPDVDHNDDAAGPCLSPHPSSGNNGAQSEIGASSKLGLSCDISSKNLSWNAIDANKPQLALNESSSNDIDGASNDNLDHSCVENDNGGEIKKENGNEIEEENAEAVEENSQATVQENGEETAEEFETEWNEEVEENSHSSSEVFQPDEDCDFYPSTESEDSDDESDLGLDYLNGNRSKDFSRRAVVGRIGGPTLRRTSNRLHEQDTARRVLLRINRHSTRLLSGASNETEVALPSLRNFGELCQQRCSRDTVSCSSCHQRLCVCRVTAVTSSSSSCSTTSTNSTTTATTNTTLTPYNDSSDSPSGCRFVRSPPVMAQKCGDDDNSILGRNSGNNWSSRALADNVLSDLSRSYAEHLEQTETHRTRFPFGSSSGNSSSSNHSHHDGNEPVNGGLVSSTLSSSTTEVGSTEGVPGEGETACGASIQTSLENKMLNSNNSRRSSTSPLSGNNSISAASRLDFPTSAGVFAVPSTKTSISSVFSTIESLRDRLSRSRFSPTSTFFYSFGNPSSTTGSKSIKSSSTSTSSCHGSTSSSDVGCGSSSSLDSISTGNGDTATSSSTESVNTRSDSSNSENTSEVSGLESSDTAGASNVSANLDSGDESSSQNSESSRNNKDPESSTKSRKASTTCKSSAKCRSHLPSPQAGSRPAPEHPQDSFGPLKSPPASPNSEEACSICLGAITDACVAGSCLHRFCFGCLKQWANHKAVCPLCKKSFTIIIHDIKGERDYKEYQVQAPFPPTSLLDDILLFSSNASTRYSRNHAEYVMNHDFILPSAGRPHRFHPRYPPNSEGAVSNRRLVYREDLWVRFTTRERLRESNPTIYRNQPALTHRLAPWLLRELRALNAPTYLLPQIMQLITRLYIVSDAMARALTPYLRHNTRHFQHEFNCFAHSSYDMFSYDIATGSQYGIYEARTSPPLDVNLEEEVAHETVEIDLTNDTIVDVSPAAGPSQTSGASSTRDKPAATVAGDESVIVSSDEESSSASSADEDDAAAATTAATSTVATSTTATTPPVWPLPSSSAGPSIPTSSDDHDYHRTSNNTTSDSESTLDPNLRQYRQLIQRIRTQETGGHEFPSVSTTVNIGLEPDSTNNTPNTNLTLTARSLGEKSNRDSGAIARQAREPTATREGVLTSHSSDQLNSRTRMSIRYRAAHRRNKYLKAKAACQEALGYVPAGDKLTRIAILCPFYEGPLSDLLAMAYPNSACGPSSSTSRQTNVRDAPARGNVPSSRTVIPKTKVAPSNLTKTVIVSSSSDDEDESTGASAADSDECLIVDVKTEPPKATKVVSIVLSDSSDGETTSVQTKPSRSASSLASEKQLTKAELNHKQTDIDSKNDRTKQSEVVSLRASNAHPLKQSRPVKLDRKSFQLNVTNIPSPSRVSTTVETPPSQTSADPTDKTSASVCSLSSDVGPSVFPSASRSRNTRDPVSDEEAVREPKDHPSRIKSSSVKFRRNKSSKEAGSEASTTNTSGATSSHTATAPPKVITVRRKRSFDDGRFSPGTLSPDTESSRYLSPSPSDDSLRVPQPIRRLPPCRQDDGSVCMLDGEDMEDGSDDNDSIASLRRRLLAASSPNGRLRQDTKRRFLTSDDDDEGQDGDYRPRGCGATSRATQPSGLFINVARVARHEISDDSDNDRDDHSRSKRCSQSTSPVKKSSRHKSRKHRKKSLSPPRRWRSPSPHHNPLAARRSGKRSNSRFPNHRPVALSPPPSASNSYKRSVYEVANSSSDFDDSNVFGRASKKSSKRIKVSVSNGPSISHPYPSTSSRAPNHYKLDSSTSLDDSASSDSDWTVDKKHSKHSSSPHKKLKHKKKKKNSKSRQDGSRERSFSKKNNSTCCHGSPSSSRKRSRHDSD